MAYKIEFRAIRPKRFRGIHPQTEKEARAGIRQYLEEIKRELQGDYDRVPTSKKYTRTKKVLRGWKIRVPSHNFGELINTADHAVYVQGPRGGGRASGSRQAAFQRRRGWQSITDVTRRTRKRYVEIMNRSLRPRVLNSF